MAHVASCIASADTSTGRASPASFSDSRNCTTPMAAPTEKPFTWRMLQQPDQAPKYQLFPSQRQLPVLNSGKADADKAMASTASQSVDKPEKPSPAANLRIRINQHNFGRRRKISVPEPGHMTTVQECAMDSPTLPGRPPLHERSASAPGATMKQNRFVDSFLTLGSEDEAELDAILDEAFAFEPTSKQPGPLSPKDLAPLVIPQLATQPPPLISKRSFNHLRSGSTPADAWRSARPEDSPMGRSLLTPSTSHSDLTTPRSACTSAPSTTTLPTPVSAPIMESSRASPKPWERRCPTPVGSGSERSMTPLLEEVSPPNPSFGHRRGVSESSTTGSIMDRGRPRKRSDPRHNRSLSKSGGETRPLKSNERKAFEELPRGMKPSEAVEAMNAADLATLQRQAMEQVERFEVLKADVVDSLSKELRNLDERTEYLRRTYHSLRAGRRNLHSRICQYLRSPRVAKFSHESMLKQEEALAELDASIDDWVTKLEVAENRRTRVRQKLLEHVAAAAILTSYRAVGSPTSEPLQKPAMPPSSLNNISTPPRSPTKQSFASLFSGNSSPSPQRVVGQVPSTILEQPIFEEVAASGCDLNRALSIASNAESIRIYAGNDIYTLLADVEDQISKMGSSPQTPPSTQPVVQPAQRPPPPPPQQQPDAHEIAETKRRELHRQRSHEMLTGLIDSAKSVLKKDLLNPPLSPPAPTPPMKDDAMSTLLLTSAVFKG
ncbi:Up-regulated during septation-domain-containing protein [Stachybotrys elegans]|uniref:Up-regulated during septation-domain-containing protein n=1 Tax=Stachybotrys elegans TaxID=80388 RepID=A0A8K0T1A4_9HYPO|nr:Up-regulated during septation-domain-containing protein [Stachybotrys elegans]